MRKRYAKKSEWKHADIRILFAAFLLLLLFAMGETVGYTRSEPLFRMLLVLCICSLFYLGGLLYHKRTGDAALMRVLFLLFFLLYLYLLLSFTLLDPNMGRGNDSVYDSVGSKRTAYIESFVNLIPFDSITLYVRGYLNGYVGLYYTAINLLGNTCAFMPLSFFLPLFFEKQKKWYLFFATLLSAVLMIELLQFAFMIGSCDVDDVILNVGGASLVYLILRLPPLQRLIRTLTKQ